VVGGGNVLATEDEELVDLVDVAVDLVVEDEEDQQLLHLGSRDVQLLHQVPRTQRSDQPRTKKEKAERATNLGDEGNGHSGVGPDKLEEHLGPDLPEDVLDELLDEGVAHDHRLVFLEDLLHPVDFVVLVGVEKVGHGLDLGVVLQPVGNTRTCERTTRRKPE